MNAKVQNLKQRYGIIGNCEQLNQALNIAVQVAPTDLSVLIVGESGVGKEVIPRLIHDNSSRKHNQYIAINCGSIPEGTIDSELFGHVKGSFTGALSDRDGYFGTANKGTLFLDEVGELPLATQARLLRVLETGEYIRVGESQVRKTDVRIVAATNVNMLKAIKEGRFREDLYYRLNTIPITLPPLRERGIDIDLLFRKFAYDMAEKYRNEAIRLTEEGRQHLMSYKWPGNIRELRNKTEQMSILCEQRLITPETLIQFGITDDGNQPGGIVLHGSSRHEQETHKYENEREMLLSSIQGLINKVIKLEADVEKLKGGNMPIKKLGTPIDDGIIDIIDGDSFMPTDNGITIIDTPTTTPQHKSAQPKTLEEIESEAIKESLERNNFNRRLVAEELGISTRTLYRWLSKHGYGDKDDIDDKEDGE